MHHIVYDLMAFYFPSIMVILYWTTYIHETVLYEGNYCDFSAIKVCSFVTVKTLAVLNW